jgi:hypothetical protein
MIQFALKINYANQYCIKKLPAIPSQFLNDTTKTKEENDKFGSWFNENCIIDCDSKIPIKKLTIECGMNEKLVKQGMMRKGFKYNKDLCGMGSDIYKKIYRGGFIGCMIKEEDKEKDNE